MLAKKRCLNGQVGERLKLGGGGNGDRDVSNKENVMRSGAKDRVHERIK